MEIAFEAVIAAPSGAVHQRINVAPPEIAPRYVDVWLPPGAAQANQRLPVIYMHDGQNIFDPSEAYGGHSWEVDRAIEVFMANTGSPGAIVVGVWNTGQRWREYAPQQPAAALRDPATIATLEAKAGGPIISDAYLRFLVHTLKPLIDATYPSNPQREQTFVMGSSMGGLISLYALEQYPEVFGGAGCLSTHWPAGGTFLVDALGAALPAAGRHRLYFDFGTEGLDAEYEPLQAQMDGHLRNAGYQHGEDWRTIKFPGADHNEVAWRSRLYIPLGFLLGQ
jgi:predicted alpha/beta superfamily hydrolase